MALKDRKVRVKNTKRTVIDGIDFSSKAEAYYYTQLKKQLENKEILSFTQQVTYVLQPQFRKCSDYCGFIWIKPEQNSPDYARYQKARICPQCEAELFTVREMFYVSDFDVTDLEGDVHVVDVKSSQFFQTDIFKMKKKIFEMVYPGKKLEMVFPKVPKGWDPQNIASKGVI